MEACKNMCRGCGMMGGKMGCGGIRGHFFLRMILGLFILAVVFAAGVKLGELKVTIEEGLYGYQMMRGGHLGTPGLYMMGGEGVDSNAGYGSGMGRSKYEAGGTQQTTTTPR